MTSIDYSALIALNDPDAILREIDCLCERRAWEELAVLRHACHLATDRGKQLWGAAGHAEYRLALEADGMHAAAVLDAEPARFALGPLPEVAASTHSWSELAPFLADGPWFGATAYERVLHGEDLSDHPELDAHHKAFEMPLTLQYWEPAYATASYLSHEARFPTPEITALDSVALADETGTLIDDLDTTDALAALVNAWTRHSSGSATVIAIEGTAQAAVARFDTGSKLHRISFTNALAYMAWAGADGGAHGQRSGLASGRSKSWWAAACLAGLSQDWPVHPDELKQAGEDLVWWTWGDLESSEGWSLRLAVEDPVDGVAFAIDAIDSA